jgi:hypothetical protein
LLPPPKNVQYTRVRWLRRRRWRCRWRSDREMRYYNDAPAWIYIYVTLLIYGLTIMYRYYSRGHPNWLLLRRFPNGRRRRRGRPNRIVIIMIIKTIYIYIYIYNIYYTHTHKYRPTTIIIITTSPSIGIYWALNTCS